MTLLFFELIVGRPSMKRMRGSLDFDKDFATFRNEEGINRGPFRTEGTDGTRKLSEEVTSDENDDDKGDLEWEPAGKRSTVTAAVKWKRRSKVPMNPKRKWF